jgi:hypothetical protein
MKRAKAPAPIIDFPTGFEVKRGFIEAVASQDPDSPEAALCGPRVIDPAPLELVPSPVPPEPDVVIPAATFARILATVDALRAELLSLKVGS